MSLIDMITNETLKEFGNSEGKIKFVCDIYKSRIYAVPKNLHYIEFISQLPEYFPKRTGRFVPSQLKIDNGSVKEIITGILYEHDNILFKPTKYLYEAHDLMWELVIRSGLKIHLDKEEILTPEEDDKEYNEAA